MCKFSRELLCSPLAYSRQKKEVTKLLNSALRCPTCTSTSMSTECPLTATPSRTDTLPRCQNKFGFSYQQFITSCPSHMQITIITITILLKTITLIKSIMIEYKITRTNHIAYIIYIYVGTYYLFNNFYI